MPGEWRIEIDDARHCIRINGLVLPWECLSPDFWYGTRSNYMEYMQANGPWLWAEALKHEVMGG